MLPSDAIGYSQWDSIYTFITNGWAIFRWRNFVNINIFAQNADCGYTLESPHRGVSNECPQSAFCITKMYAPVNPIFTIIQKWGIRGYTFHGHVLLVK